MTILGIDYGSKRVGIALSDTSETLAFPKDVLANTKELVYNISVLLEKDHVNTIVIGYSVDGKGKENMIMNEMRVFIQSLKEKTEIPIIFEQESFSSLEAGRYMGTHDMLDASAAAIILQRFLDRRDRGSKNQI